MKVICISLILVLQIACSTKVMMVNDLNLDTLGEAIPQNSVKLDFNSGSVAYIVFSDVEVSLRRIESALASKGYSITNIEASQSYYVKRIQDSNRKMSVIMVLQAKSDEQTYVYFERDSKDTGQIVLKLEER